MEILAPAGSLRALAAAVHNGADAVYVGGSRYSARKNAQNFTDEELAYAVDFCHVRGVRLYLCCNTLLKEAELHEAMRFVRYAYQIGVDALIIQDLGLMQCVRQLLPDMPIHASTQMTVTNSDGVNTLAALGAKRVVLAREVTALELAEIQKNTQTELEYFVHGALCISYSGQCLMSSILGGRSGNRGACAQPCRLPYTLLKDKQPVGTSGTILCTKDLCLADRVGELAALGVASLKIEGRMKSPEYVAMVTQIYKQAAKGRVSGEDIQSMLQFFSRGGSCHGYFDGCTYDGMMDTLGGTKIAERLPTIKEQKKTVPVQLYFTAQVEKPITLTMLSADGEAVTVTGANCQKAHTRPTTAERIQEQLAKLGGTPFHATRIEIEASPEAAVAVQEINGLRRQAAERLETKITQQFHRELPPERHLQPRQFQHVKTLPELCVEVCTEEQLKAAIHMGIRRIYLPEALLSFQDQVEEPVFMLPPLTKELQKTPVRQELPLCVQNVGQLPKQTAQEVTAGHRLNITNSQTIALLETLGVSRFVLSPELNIQAIGALRKKTAAHLEIIGYGRLPLMLLENCIIKSAYHCGCEEGNFALLDRKNEVFPILPTRCGNVIYNSKPVYMADRMSDIINLQIDSIRLSFSIENYKTCCIIIKEYQEALLGNGQRAPSGGFTRGHFYRGMQ